MSLLLLLLLYVQSTCQHALEMYQAFPFVCKAESAYVTVDLSQSMYVAIRTRSQAFPFQNPCGIAMVLNTYKYSEPCGIAMAMAMPQGSLPL